MARISRIRNNRSLKRKGGTRPPRSITLIVCEGEKTEPEYLRRLRNALGLNAANISITPANGSDPVSIVRHAIQAYDNAGGEFDRVF